MSEEQTFLNVSKTKELIVDFRKQERVHTSSYINGSAVERVSCFKFLGVYINKDLTWSVHTTQVVRRLNRAFTSSDG